MFSGMAFTVQTLLSNKSLIEAKIGLITDSIRPFITQTIAGSLYRGSPSKSDLRKIKQVTTMAQYRELKKLVEALDTLRSSESFVGTKLTLKRVSIHSDKNDEYIRSVLYHQSRCGPRGGFVKKSGLHSRPTSNDNTDD